MDGLARAACGLIMGAFDSATLVLSLDFPKIFSDPVEAVNWAAESVVMLAVDVATGNFEDENTLGPPKNFGTVELVKVGVAPAALDAVEVNAGIGGVAVMD